MPDRQLTFQDALGIPGDAATPARRGDPETSSEAAASVTHLTAKRRAVLSLLATYGEHGLTDAELAQLYAVSPLPPQSPSGLRTRRRELTDALLVHDTGRRAEHDTGRRHIVWAITPAGRAALQ